MDRIARLKEMLEAHPADSFLQHALALEYVKTGDDVTAETLFKNVLSQNENYVGTYYHLAKLLERNHKTEEAIAVYEKGMQKAKEEKDQHAYNELLVAYEDLTF